MFLSSKESPQSCTRCGYDLSAVPPSWTTLCPLEITCSECGARHACRDLFNPLFRPPRWSVEHAARRLVLRGFMVMDRSLWPPLLWGRTGLKREHPVRVARLLIFLAAIILTSHFFVATLTAVTTYDRVGRLGTFTASGIAQTRVSLVTAAALWPYGGALGPHHWAYRPMFNEVWGVLLLWMALTPLFTWAFTRFSRPRIAPSHLLRVSVYSLSLVFPAITLWVIAFTAYVLGLWPRAWGFSGTMTQLLYNAWLPCGVLGVWLIVYWLTACTRYLRPRHAALIAIACLTLALFVTITILARWPGSDLLHQLRLLFGSTR